MLKLKTLKYSVKVQMKRKKLDVELTDILWLISILKWEKSIYKCLACQDPLITELC